MTKSYCKPTTPIDQDNIIHINGPGFCFEDGFCRRLNKIQGIADLLFCAGSGEASIISSKGYFGMHNILDESVKELREICYKMLEWEGGARCNSNQL